MPAAMSSTPARAATSVKDDARLLEVGAAAFDADGLGDRDLHVVHVLGVPERLEDAVGEPHRHDVLDGLLPEVVVDAVAEI